MRDGALWQGKRPQRALGGKRHLPGPLSMFPCVRFAMRERLAVV